AGPTVVQERATLVIPSDAALGAGGPLTLGGTLSLAGAWTTARPVIVNNLFGEPVVIATNGFDATINGTVSAPFFFETLQKAGAGRLTLTAESPFAGTLEVRTGELRLSGQGAVRAPTADVEVGATLTFDNTGTNVNGRLTPGTNFFLTGGELRLLGA